MKKLLLLFFVIGALCTACKDDKELGGTESEQKEVSLSVTPTELEFPDETTEKQTVSVEGATSYTISKSNDWILITDKEAGKFSVGVKRNTDDETFNGVDYSVERYGAIAVKADNGDSVVVAVKQLMWAAPSKLEFTDSDTVRQTVTVNSYVTDWQVEANDDWISVDKQANSFSVAVQRLYSTSQRTGTITVRTATLSPVIVTVTQLGVSHIEPSVWTANPDLQELRAFPGAEGFGAYTSGGRSGVVVYVTNLNDNGEGSFRHAVTRNDLGGAPRTVMFKVAGIIRLNSSLRINRSNITIAGHSAPGDGICIANRTVSVQADNVVIRYMRFRLGYNIERTDGNDALEVRNDRRNIILDHCSVSWGMDETGSFYDNENFTLQWCILSEGLLTRRFLGLWGGRKASFHHNLLATFSGRFPRLNGARYSNRPNEEHVDFRNNVLYNWGNHNGAGGEGGRYNLVNNYYQPGPESYRPTFMLQASPSGGAEALPAGIWGAFYISGNIMMTQDGTLNDSINNDNWLAVDTDPGNQQPKPTLELKSNVEFDKGNVTTHTAQEAYELVLANAGASFSRDAIDARVVNEVRNRIAERRNSGESNAEKNIPIGLINREGDVGGLTTYTYNGADVPVDTDEDGIPDEWETTNGLNPNDPSDGPSISLSGTYSNLEVYLYDLLRSKE